MTANDASCCRRAGAGIVAAHDGLLLPPYVLSAPLAWLLRRALLRCAVLFHALLCLAL
ncbi:MAG TPA: hypothetical protein VFA18_24680 [Gemmataceae bacterium]|nr:hypothetical protein [Gemmataceae bacterium]